MIKVLNEMDINMSKKSESKKYQLESDFKTLEYNKEHTENTKNHRKSSEKHERTKVANGNLKDKALKYHNQNSNSIENFDDSGEENTQKNDLFEEAKGISLAESLKSAINSSNKEKIDWILSQKIRIENTVSDLSSFEVEYLIDILIQKLLNQKTKLIALTWLEEILKTCNHLISSNKLIELKSCLKTHSSNYSIVLETLSKFQILEEIRKRYYRKLEEDDDLNQVKGKQDYGNRTKKEQKPKINLIYNEMDSEDEKKQIHKENVLKSIQKKEKESKANKKKEMNNKTQGKLKGKLNNDLDEENEIDDDDDDSALYEDDEIKGDEEIEENSEDKDFEEDLDEEEEQ